MTHENGALPVAVIGGGPIGLAAAVELLRRGERPLVLEAGREVGASIRAWGHVRLFTPWRANVPKVACDLLKADGWAPPAPDEHPTGDELVDAYLKPLAAHPALAPHVRVGRRVESVGRAGLDKLKTGGRERVPFELAVRLTDGGDERYLARAVVDASGTWLHPNPLGAGGRAAEGERSLAARITYGIPDVLGDGRAQFPGRATAVVGSGHSALNTLLDLLRLADEAPGTRVHWIVRRPTVEGVLGLTRDDLPERARLEHRVADALAGAAVTLSTGVAIVALRERRGGVLVVSADGRQLGPFDEVVAACGFRPDLELTRELRLDLDEIVEAPRRLAPLIDPNVHSCRTVPVHGEEVLAHPEEPGFYVTGMKSYGRAPTFLMRTGYEQVRSIVAALAGDREAARPLSTAAPVGCGDVACSPTGAGAASCGDEAADRRPDIVLTRV